jgi:PKD repeat protein
MKLGKGILLAMLGLLLPMAVWAAPPAKPLTPIKVVRGVQVGEPVTPISLNIDLRQLPVVPEWRPGMPIHEAHKRQFYPLNHANPAAPAYIHALPDRLPELQQLWDQNAPAHRSLRTPGSKVSINNGGTGVSPGDPVVGVSTNYVIYAVNGSTNTTFTVYDKTGTKLSGPTAFSSMAPAGDGCNSKSNGDPLILFDRLANRWFLLEMGGASGAPKMCVYISKSENPVSGGWWFYGFATPVLNDYPHCGAWTNAYVCTDNEGGANVVAYAYDRDNMLLGATARPLQRFASVPSLAGYSFQALTPITFTGDAAHAPPSGSLQILARHDDDEAHAGASADGTKDFIDLYSLNVDWTTPANSSIGTLPRIAITEFNSWFRDYSTFDTVPQPGSTSRIDPIREVILNSLVYRNVGAYESIVGQFATNQNAARTGTVVDAGIRWFELRRTGGNWVLQQEGTFSPGDTSTHHLLGTIATDNKGNIALGYNVTRTTAPLTYASLGYTGRKAADPSGVMTQGENLVAAGTAVETSGRWGDYYSMAVDPVDDCTFWMVGMYRPASTWNTRLANFKFDDCGTATTYSISGTVATSGAVGINGVTVSTGAVSTTTNASGAYTLSGLSNGAYTLTPSLSGYTFAPANRSVTISGAAVTGQDFTGTVFDAPPMANFSFTTSGLVATFTDSSTDSGGTIASHSWNFGDGGTSTATNPSHTYAASGTFSVTETVTDNGGQSASKTSSVTVSSGNVLSNGVAKTGLAAATGAYLKFTMVVPAGATALKFVQSGGTGDSDMYVKFGSEPTDSVYDCRPYVSGNAETCTITTAQAGTYYINLKGYAAFTGVSLTGSYSTSVNTAPTANWTYSQSGLTATFIDTSTDPQGNATITGHTWNFGDGATSTTASPSHTYAAMGNYTVSETVTDNGGLSNTKTTSVMIGTVECGGTALCSGTAVTLPSVATGGVSANYTLIVPAGKTSLVFTISGGTGDADLYVNLGSAPTTATYTCRPYTSGNAETCTFNSPAAGTYYVNVRAYAAYSGVSLKGTFSP